MKKKMYDDDEDEPRKGSNEKEVKKKKCIHLGSGFLFKCDSFCVTKPAVLSSSVQIVFKEESVKGRCDPARAATDKKPSANANSDTERPLNLRWRKL
ncbi:Hypothetical predicted protein [Scomber scombrus]|uniref:Uncharacterized protein n=1 Tax=Scomber scombrus TaxID=13677 RepID=A0AAV1QB38_SCOSC